MYVVCVVYCTGRHSTSRSGRRVGQSLARVSTRRCTNGQSENSCAGCGRHPPRCGCESTPFRVHWFQGDTISLQSRILTHSSKNSVEFYSFLVLSSWWVFLTERFFPIFKKIFFVLTLSPSFGLFFCFCFFFFNAFFLAGVSPRLCLAFSGVHFVMAMSAAQTKKPNPDPPKN